MNETTGQQITGSQKLGAQTQHELEGVKLPDGRELVTVEKNKIVLLEITPGELARVLIKAGVPGVSHSQGKDANLRAYKSYRESIAKKAAEEALEKWTTNETAKA